MATNAENPKELRDNLLKANGISPTGPSDNDREQMRLLLEKQVRKQTRSKRLVWGMWIAFVAASFACAIVSFVFIRHRPDWMDEAVPALFIIAYVLFLASIYATIRHWMTGRSVSQQEVLYHLMRIEAQLEEARKVEKSTRSDEEPSGS